MGIPFAASDFSKVDASGVCLGRATELHQPTLRSKAVGVEHVFEQTSNLARLDSVGRKQIAERSYLSRYGLRAGGRRMG